MSEMSVILQNANEKSLIIIDELARSTSTEEGIGISYAICEELINSKAFVFFATHYLDLSFLELNYPVVANFHFTFKDCETQIENFTRKISHIIHKGRYKGPLYGLELAELTTLPESVINKARLMVEYLRAKIVNVEDNTIAIEVSQIIRQKKLSYLATKILNLIQVSNSLNNATLSTHLKQLQLNYSRNNLF